MNPEQQRTLRGAYGVYVGVTARSDEEERLVWELYHALRDVVPDLCTPLPRTTYLKPCPADSERSRGARRVLKELNLRYMVSLPNPYRLGEFVDAGPYTYREAYDYLSNWYGPACGEVASTLLNKLPAEADANEDEEGVECVMRTTSSDFNPATPWRNMLRLMAVVPEAERRLAHGVAWDRYLGCGCLLGTLYPETPRDPDENAFMGVDFSNHACASDGYDIPWLAAFPAWCKRLGLDGETVSELQALNDKSVDATEAARWARVYDFIKWRAEGDPE